ncbi:MAG: FixH family protein [Crocinitomicaceae bacterium]|jgi:hypothetical protein|nr:FixH family protein [Crocinitomicaceae bacterium]
MNWGKGIALALSVFIVFIVTLATIMMRTKVDLVSDDYYQQEIQFEHTLEAQKRGEELAAFHVSQSNNSVKIVVDNALESETRVQFYRPNNRALDLDYSMKDGLLIIPENHFQKGVYEVVISGEAGGKEYQQKREFYFKP